MSTATNKTSDSGAANQLSDSIARVRKRLFSINGLAACGWMLLVGVAVLIVAIWFDLLWELSPFARVTSFVFAAAAAMAAFTFLMMSVMRKSDRYWLAGRLDKVGDTGGEIVSGLELANELKRTNGDNRLSTGLAAMAVSRAAAKADSIDHVAAVPLKPLKSVGIALASVGLLVAVISISMPRLAKTQWSRFVNPTTDAPPFSTMEFEVTPGNVSVKYGDPLDIVAQLKSTPVDSLQLTLFGDKDETVPMFDEGGDRWKAGLFRVTHSMQYQVQSGRARSTKYQITVISVPEIEDVEFMVTPPKYTRLATYRVKAGEPLKVLRGTKIGVRASSNRPLSVGHMKFAKSKGTKTGSMVELSVSETDSDQDTQVTGQFEVHAGGKFELSVTDTEGVVSTQGYSGTIEMIRDTKPFVRMMEPKQNSWATPTVSLPIALLAEDDFGVASVTLYRSLNDSRPLPLAMEVKSQSTRWQSKSGLPLGTYGLSPGDKLELFARVEDNDPAGAKGSESPIHTVFIISNQQFDQMNQQQLGLEAVLSKYRQIERQLEALEVMQREIEAMENDPEKAKEQPSEKMKKELRRAAQQFKNNSRELQKLLERKFPVDLDRNMEERIDQMSEDMLEMAREIRNLIKRVDKGELTNEQLKEELKKLREKIQGAREDFNNEVMEPVGKLAKLFPLMQKQEQFIQIVLRQENLAGRLKALEGVDNQDDPAKKRRMRDLSDEQGRLLDVLDRLLSDIEEEALALPAEEEFEKLRDTAIKFASDVNDSDALEEMETAERELAEFSGTKGFEHADKAAKILRTFVKRAEQGKQDAQQQAEQQFDPQQQRPPIGNSVEQLMKMFGPRNGGQMQGGGNRGLYGNNPRSQQQRRGGGSGKNRRRGGGGSGFDTDPAMPPAGEVKRSSGQTGSGSADVPLRYERKVGEYYRRIVEELGEQN